jgi:hypothetical protein
MAFPGGYPNLHTGGDAERAVKSYGSNVDRLIRARRRYDPDNFMIPEIFSFRDPPPVNQKT